LAKEPKHILAKKAFFFSYLIVTKLKQICTKIDAHTPQNINCSSCYPFSHCYVQIVWTGVFIPVSTGMVSKFFLFHQRPNNNNKNSSWCFSHMKHHIICNGTPNKWVIPSFIGNNATPYTNPLRILKHLFINLTGNHIQFFSINSRAFYIFAVGIITNVSPVFLVFFQRLWQGS